MPSQFNLVGQKFGKLTVIRESTNKYTAWLCLCECGSERIVLQCHLRSGHTVSCGCWNATKIGLLAYKHGGSSRRMPEYYVYQSMKSRCYNKKNPEYKNYGGRGITVSQRWLKSFSNFLEDMGNRPSEAHSLDRIDNNKGYEYKNCRWATDREQNENRRNSVFHTYNGVTMLQSDWCKKLGRTPGWIQYHIKNGKSFDWIVNRPKRTKQ